MTVVTFVFHMRTAQLFVNSLQDGELKFFETTLPIFVHCNNGCLEALDKDPSCVTTIIIRI